MRSIIIGVLTAAITLIGVTLLKDRYFAAAFAVLCLVVAERVAA